MANVRFQVGSRVRAARPNHPKLSGCAIVATEPDDNDHVCLLWESTAPEPINIKLMRQNKAFLVTPILSPKKKEEEEEETEAVVSINNIQPLLPFENSEYDKEDASLADWKDWGDQLLRLGDAFAAVPYYEIALSKSSVLQVGCTIILQRGGFLKLAEVDYIEDTSVDVTLVDSGEESTISKSSILLCLLDPDADKIQERILLNLARCLFQLADLDDGSQSARPQYLKAAVLSCTLAVTISTFHEGGEERNTLPINLQTALILRAQAQARLSKFAHAFADAKRVAKAGNKQGQKLLQDLERQQKQRIKTDKKLAKEVCKWVQTATGDLA